MVATVTDPNYVGSASGTLVISSVTITLQANVPGVPITVDGGVPQVSTWTGLLGPGAHTISVPTTVAASVETRYVFGAWSDSGAASHSITVTANATCTVSFGTEYLLTTSAGNGGTVSAGGFYTAGNSAMVTATPAIWYAFGGFTGAVTTSGNPISVVMDAPKHCRRTS